MARENRLLYLSLSLLTTFLFSFSKEIEVCRDCPIGSVKRAIELARAGDTIRVRGGTYREGTIEISKSVKLLGIDKPVLDGEGKYEVVRITAPNVILKGFKIVNSGRSELEDIAGVKVENTHGCRIEDNVLENNFWAIYLANVKDCVVEGNVIRGPFKVGEAYSGNGIHLWHCKRVKIKDNYITGHRDGIYFEFVEDSRIEGNVSEGNWRYGLHFMFSHRDEYLRNTFRKNGVGVAVMYTKKVVMRENLFELNWGGASYGLLLKAIDDSLIERNTFYKNTAGILMDECQRSVIRNNDFIENGWALRVWANSMDNRIMANNFLSNTFEMSTNSDSNPNTIEGNYWSSYRGYDLNGDGVGDVPYKPVKLFSYVLENNPAAAVLLRSFFVQLLDFVEESLPAVVSVSVEDPRPLMSKIEWKR